MELVWILTYPMLMIVHLTRLIFDEMRSEVLAWLLMIVLATALVLAAWRRVAGARSSGARR